MTEPYAVESSPSVGGIVTLFTGAMLGTSGATWALRHGTPIPAVSMLAPLVALVVTGLLISIARGARQRLGVPMSAHAWKRQLIVLAIAFGAGLMAGVIVGSTVSQAPASVR